MSLLRVRAGGAGCPCMLWHRTGSRARPEPRPLHPVQAAASGPFPHSTQPRAQEGDLPGQHPHPALPHTTASRCFPFPAARGRKREQHHPGPKRGLQQQRRVGGGGGGLATAQPGGSGSLQPRFQQTLNKQRSCTVAGMVPCCHRAGAATRCHHPCPNSSAAGPPSASPHCHRAGSGALQAAAGGQRAHGRRNRRHNVPTGTQTFYFLPAVLSRQRRTTTKHQEGTTEEETTRATHAKHRDTLTVRNTAAQSLDPSTAPRTPSSTHSPPLGAPLPCIQSAMPAGPGALQQPGAVLCAAAAFLQHRGCAHLWAVPCSEGYGHRLALSPHGRAVAVPPGCAGSLARARSTLSRCLGCRKALWCIPRDNLGGRGCGVRGFHTTLPSTQ